MCFSQLLLWNIVEEDREFDNVLLLPKVRIIVSYYSLIFNHNFKCYHHNYCIPLQQDTRITIIIIIVIIIIIKYWNSNAGISKFKI